MMYTFVSVSIYTTSLSFIIMATLIISESRTVCFLITHTNIGSSYLHVVTVDRPLYTYASYLMTCLKLLHEWLYWGLASDSALARKWFSHSVTIKPTVVKHVRNPKACRNRLVVYNRVSSSMTVCICITHGNCFTHWPSKTNAVNVRSVSLSHILSYKLLVIGHCHGHSNTKETQRGYNTKDSVLHVMEKRLRSCNAVTLYD